ncbi:MAG: ABC transporter permease [Eubacterium sp.]|jgi:ABC-2 type transport system permease protein|nr:ABC transporter permease [Eubacterium sp.]
MKKKKKKEASHFLEMFDKYKSLLYELTRKNIKLKYRDSWLGIFWSFLQPLLTMAVLSVVFGNIFGAEREYIVCYPVYLFSGRLLFEFFTSSSKMALNSFRSNAAIIKKVYVPKYMYPLSGILSNFVTFSISILCYICVWIFFKLTGMSDGGELTLTPYVLLFFIPMAILLMFVVGVGLILSILQVYFRDIQYIWDVFCTLLFYMVPAIYHINSIKSDWTRAIIQINPLYSMIELFRQCVLYGEPMQWQMLLYALAWALGVLLIGIFIFNKKSDDLVFHL